MSDFAKLLQSEQARLGIKRFELAALLGIPYPRPFQGYLNGKVVPHALFIEGAKARMAAAQPKKKEGK